MNHFRITIELSTTHDSPEEWISEYIADELELDESEHALLLNANESHYIVIRY